MAKQIQLIVGLGNPGTEYAETRHNAGVWAVEELAGTQPITLRPESKFFGLYGKLNMAHVPCHLLVPTTYMNHSGQAVSALANFYRLDHEAILVLHDELDLPPGTLRFKQGGGDGGHNGLKSISTHLKTNHYWRLRIGIGHPGQRHLVSDYVLSRPARAEALTIKEAITRVIHLLPAFINGEHAKTMQQLHTN